MRRIDEAELEILLMEEAERLADYVRRRIPPAQQSVISPEDILQEVWISAFRNIETFRDDGPNAFPRWVTRIAERKLLDALRNAARLKRGGGQPPQRLMKDYQTSMLDLYALVGAEQRTPSSEDAAREAVRAVQHALGSLPDDYRRVITMRHLDGRTCAEIAEAMDRTRPAVNGLLFRGLRKLRERLGSEGNFFSDSTVHDDDVSSDGSGSGPN